MTMVTIEGTYKDGQISLAEPVGVKEARVLVTFLPVNESKPQSQHMRLGQFSGPEDRMSTEEDFKAAEWHPTSEDLDV
jgi:hypothetical protein